MRRIRSFIAALLAASLLGGAALAQAPSGKSARILVGFPPGQATDLVARMVAERLTTSMGYPVLVENQPGQGGSIVLSRLAKSTPDGATLSLSALAAYVVNPYLYKNVSYDSTKDFDPIALVADLPMVLVVHPSVPVGNLKELLDYIKANPEKLSHSSSGNGTLSHLLMEDLKHRSGVRLLHVPYQGSPRAVADLIAGTVQVGLDTVTVLGPQIKAGKLKVIAAGTKVRLPAFPELPTIAESGYPGFEAVAWIALTAPAGTPRELRERMNADINRALREPAFSDKLVSIGAVPRGGSTDELAAHFRSEQKRWKEVVERSGAKAD
jgi:tripartite-type tricarboxylate transporter receptor subunit TctC